MASTTTLCFLFCKKLIIQLVTYGFISSVFNLEQRISWGTESKALLKSKEKILTQSKPDSSHFSQAYWHLIKAIVVLWPLRYANWSKLMKFFIYWDNSCLYTRRSKTLIITLVSEIGRNCVQFLKLGSLGKGVMSANFQRSGTMWFSKEQLKIWVTTGARSYANSFQNQYGIPSGPEAVLFNFSRLLVTLETVKTGISLDSGIVTVSMGL